MEKVIIVRCGYNFDGYQPKEVKTFLEIGWKVKSVTLSSDKESTYAVFVLEK